MRAAIAWRGRPQAHDKVSVRANGRRNDTSLQIDVYDLSVRLDTWPERLHPLATVTARYVRDVSRSQGGVLAQPRQVWHSPRQETVRCGIVQAPGLGLDGRRDRQCERSICLEAEQTWKFDFPYDTRSSDVGGHEQYGARQSRLQCFFKSTLRVTGGQITLVEPYGNT